jgi:hypothetical protein
MRWAVVAVAMLTVAGCASRNQFSNRTTARVVSSRQGRPQMMVAGVTRSAMLASLVTQMVGAGFNPTRVGDYQAEFERSGGTGMGILGAALMGADDMGSAVWRVTYTCTDTPNGVNVVGDVAVVGRRTRLDMNSGKPAFQMQSLLEQAAYAAPKTQPVPPKTASSQDSTGTSR